jgi:hypothetical protein
VNTLSLLIYLSGVAGALGGFLVFVTVIFGLLAGVSLATWLIHQDETDKAGYSLKGEALISCQDTRKSSWRWFWRFLSLMVLCGTVTALTPSRQTVLLIAASEMGERVLNHERVTHVIDPGIDLLKTWMEKETSELRRSMSTNTTPKKD